MAPTPRALGYRMPAEWERHEATWLAWPKDTTTFPGSALREVEHAYCEMAEAVRRGEEVRILVDGGSEEERVENLLEEHGVGRRGVQLFRVPTADVWIRDYGPTFIVRGRSPKLAFVKWTFNAWGNKYESLKRDDGVPDRLRPALGVPVFRPRIVMEGGAIDVNGSGSCLTTESCVLNRNRNPGLAKTRAERIFRDHLGAGNVVWLRRGLAGDDTDGHIDELARFTGPRTVVCALDGDRRSPNHRVLRANFERLAAARDEEGEPFDLFTLPMPGPMVRPRGFPHAGARLPASYANFYICNRAVLLPAYGHRNDARAREVLQEAIPDRDVVEVPCRALALGFGAIHCVTQQQPAP